MLGETRAPVSALLREYGYSFMRPDEEGRLHFSDHTRYGSDIFAVAPNRLPAA
jgi:hypothetical protein